MHTDSPVATADPADLATSAGVAAAMVPPAHSTGDPLSSEHREPVTGSSIVATDPVGERTAGSFLRWDSGHLVVTDPARLTKLSRSAMSASTMHAMEGCPSRWVSEKLLETGEDPFSPTAVGSAAHAVLEELFKLPPDQRTRETAALVLIRHANQAWPSVETLDDLARRHMWLVEVTNAYTGLFELEDPTSVEVHRTEWKLQGMRIGGVPFIGFVDRAETVDGTLRLVDYKSSVKMPTLRFGDPHGDQLRLYVEAVESLGKEVGEAAVLYTRLGKVKKAALAPERRRDTVKRFRQAWDDLTGYQAAATFPVNPTALCGWCPLVNSCPTAQRQGLEDRTGTALSAAQLNISVVGEPVTDPTAADTQIPSNPADEDGEVFLTPEQVALAGNVSAGSAPDTEDHTDTDPEAESAPGDQETEMTLIDDRPYLRMSNGNLNPSSYAFQAAFRIVQMATQTLHRAGVTPTRSAIKAVADLYTVLVTDAQHAWTGGRDLHEGSATNFWWSLTTVLRMSPPPFGSDQDEWDAWIARTAKRLSVMGDMALELVSDLPTGVDVARLASLHTPRSNTRSEAATAPVGSADAGTDRFGLPDGVPSAGTDTGATRQHPADSEIQDPPATAPGAGADEDFVPAGQTPSFDPWAPGNDDEFDDQP